MENFEEAKNKINLFEYHKIFDQDVVLSYKGPFESYILAILGNYIEVTLGHDKQASRKMFAIFIELAQNIALYSADGTDLKLKAISGIGTIAMGESDKYYTLATGNLVRTQDVIPVIEKCELINSLDRESLRKYKIEQRNLSLAKSDRSNIGLIQVALATSRPLDIEVIPIDKETSFFTISVKIDKI